MLHADNEDAVADFIHRLKQFDDLLFQAEIVEIRFGSRSAGGAHFSGFDHPRRRVEDRFTVSNGQVNGPERDGLE